MNTVSAKLKGISCLAIFLASSVILAACSGGGGGTSVSSTGGSAAASVSMSSATDYPSGTTFSTTAATAAVSGAPSPATDIFDNVWVAVTKIALIPSTGTENPDRDGELEEANESSEEGDGGKAGFFTIVLPAPVTFNLLKPPTSTQLAKFVNKTSGIPAGEYSKIRVYYSSVVGQEHDGTSVAFHQTAHYHFDVHFVGGNLSIPVSTDPEGGIKFFQIAINVVGLKIHQAGKSDNYLLRPQVFARVDAVKYLVSGLAENVDQEAGTFDIHTWGGVIVPAVFNAETLWFYVDNSVPATAWGSVGEVLGSKGLRNTATVDAMGEFLSGNVLDAEEADVTFPDSLNGKVLSGWNPDNTFTLRTTLDNVVPKPSRSAAYYDNASDSSYPRLVDGPLAIVDNVSISARGYAISGGIHAYWISIGDVGP